MVRAVSSVRALGATAPALLGTTLTWHAFANLYWSTRGGSLFEVWPLMAFAAVVMVVTISVVLYRFVGPGRAPLTRSSGLALLLSVGVAIAIGIFIFVRPVLQA